MCSQALIGLGSNVGDRKATLDGAIAALREIEGVNPRAVSSYHETQPVGGQPGQGAFLNAVAVLEPSLDAFGLLYALHWVEDQFLRERTFRWGERTLDLDLLLLGDEVCFNRELILPHPRFAYRRFVLAPAAEVAPNAVDPMSGHSIAELLENVNRRPSLVCIDHLDPNETPQRAKVIADVRNRLCERLNGVIVPHPGSGEIGRSRSTYRDMAEDRYRQLTMAAHALSPHSLPILDSADSWLVADFSLQRQNQRARKTLFHVALDSGDLMSELSALSSVRLAAEAAIEQALSPTIAILLAGRDLSGNPLALWSSPVVIVGSDDLEKITDEAVVACQATRS